MEWNILTPMSIHRPGKDSLLRRNRALENRVYVAKADSVGEQNGLVNFGGSMVVNPEGEVIAEAKKGRQEMLEFNL